MMPDDFEERLRAAMRRESDRLPFSVRMADVERRLAEPSRRFQRWLALAAIPLGTAVVVAALLAAPRVGRVATNPTAIPEVIAGGCGSTQLFAPPGPTAVPSLKANPWARATPAEAGITAYLWGDPPYLAAGKIRPLGQGNKILWISDREPSGHLVIAAHALDAPSPEVRFDFPSALSPSGNYPSLIDLPSSGCWRLDLTIGTTKATIELLVAPPGSSPAPTATSRVAPAPPSCPITKRPDPPFVPPPSFLGTPLNGSGRAFYYGTNDLWTKVYADGSWGGARDASGGYGNKSFWWSDAFRVDKEPQPALQVTGRRLDGPAEAAHSDRATNAAASDIGSAMLTGVTLPTAGCWELTGHYRGHDLSYVVWVPEEPAVPTPGSPAPCATSGSPAVEGLPSAGQASFEIFPGQHPDSRGGAGVFVRVAPPTNAQTLLVTAFLLESRDRNVGGAISHALLDRDRRPSTGDAAGTRFRGSILLPGRGCWQLRAVLNGQALDGSAVVLHGDEPYRPAGVFQSEMSVRQMPCLGIAIDGPMGGQSAVPAWWWDAGSSGNCATRTSDLVATKATVRDDGSGYEVLFELPLLNGASDQIRLRLTTDGRDLIGAGDRGDVRFLRVEVVDPSFAPVSG